MNKIFRPLLTHNTQGGRLGGGDGQSRIAINRFKRIVNENLEAGKPMGLSYNTKHIAIKGGHHASVVVAREWRNNRCEFKVRNSRGKVCKYLNKIECIQEEGSSWVEDQLFFKMATNITYID